MILLTATQAASPIPLLGWLLSIIIIVFIVIVLFLKGKSDKQKTKRICPKCGKSVSENNTFCTNCGTKVE